MLMDPFNPFSNSHGRAARTLLVSVNGDSNRFGGVETGAANMPPASQVGSGRMPSCSSKDLVFGRTGKRAVASTLIDPGARILSSICDELPTLRRGVTMKLHSALVAGVVLASAPAQASDERVILTQHELSNSLIFDVSGSLDPVPVLQAHHGLGAANEIDVDIKGDFNGGPLGGSFTGAAPSIGLTPGSLTQSGFDNHIKASVTGSRNLFAFAQEGSGNRLTASVSGIANQAAVSQTGFNNVVGLSQSGIDNMIGISQTSW